MKLSSTFDVDRIPTIKTTVKSLKLSEGYLKDTIFYPISSAFFYCTLSKISHDFLVLDGDVKVLQMKEFAF